MRTASKNNLHCHKNNVKYSLFSINILAGISLCCDAFEKIFTILNNMMPLKHLNFKFFKNILVLHCADAQENTLAASIVLLIITILEWYLYLFIAFNTRSSVFSQSQEITQSGNLRVAIVYVIAKLFRQCRTPQSAQKVLLPKSVVHYLCHLKSNIIIGQRKTTNKEKHFYP